MKKLLLTIAIMGGVYLHSNAQCGPASIDVTNYCPDQYAEFTINDTDPNVKYRWYNDAAGVNDLGYGPEGVDGKYFISLTTLPTGSGTQTYYYQREKLGVSGGPELASWTASLVNNSNQVTPGDYSLDFTSDADFELNEVTIIVNEGGMDQTWYSKTLRVQVEVGGTFSEWYYFDKSNVTKVSGDYYAVTIPVLVGTDPMSVTAGTTNIQVHSSTGGGGDAVTVAFANSTSLNNSYTIGSTGSSITVDQDGNDQSGWWGDARPAIFDWNVNFKCPIESVSAIEETDLTKCCTPVTAQPVLTTTSGETVLELPISETINSSNATASHYYRWYLNGNIVSEGIGTSGFDDLDITQPGRYTLRVVEDGADVNKASCYIESDLFQVEEKILFAVASSESICIGDQISLTADGALSNVVWSPSNYISDINAFVTSATPEQTITYTVTAEVPSGNLVDNWDFEDGNVGFDVSPAMTNAPASDITYTTEWINNQNVSLPTLDFEVYGNNGNGVYAIVDEGMNQGGWQLAWGCVDHTSGAGNFFLHDAMSNNTLNNAGITNDVDAYLWKQDVIVEAGKTYDFSAWFANASSETAGPPEIQLYVNDIPILGTPWQPAANTTEWGACDWHEVIGSWSSGTYNGTVTLKVVELSHEPSGNDFIMDDVMFSSGTSTQSDDVTITVADCFQVDAFQNTSCVNDSSEIEVTTNGLFLGWTEEGGGTSSIKSPTLQTTLVSPPVETKYVAEVRFPLGNQLLNGDFELGNQGFTSDLNYGATSVGPGGYSVGTNPNAMNSYFATIGDHTTGSGNMLVLDAGSSTDKLWATDVTVEAGKEYAFSTWISNVNGTFENPPEIRFVIDGVNLNLIDFPENTNDWFQYSSIWTATTTGTITIQLSNENTGSNGNDLAIDDIVFAPLFDETRYDTVTVAACVPPCAPPTAVDMTTAGPIDICEGDDIVMNANVTEDSSPLDDYYYTWYHKDVAITTPTITADDAHTVAGTGVTLVDSGYYKIRVEDGNNDDPLCYLEDSIYVNITAIPAQPGSITGTADICENTTGNTYSITAVDGATGYTWAYSGTGATITGTSTSITVAFATGSTDGNLTVTADNGCGSSATQTIAITIKDLPTAPGIITGDNSVCEGTTGESYSVTAVTDHTYTWAYTQGSGATISSTANTADYDFSTSATDGYVKVTATNDCGALSDSLEITILDLPEAPTAITGTSPVCAGTDDVAYSVTNDNTVTYSWNYTGSGVTIDGTTNSIELDFGTTATSGNLEVTVTATNGCGTDGPTQLAIEVNDVPQGTGIVTGNTTVCKGSTETYSVSGVTDATSYTWTLPSTASGSSTTNSIDVTFDNGPSAAIQVTPTNTCGTGTMVTTNVTIDSIPTITDQPDTVGLCAGSTANFSVTAVGPGTISYQWYKNNTIMSAEQSAILSFASVTAGDAGDYTVEVTNGCGTVTSEIARLNITLTEFPDVTLVADSTTLCEGSNVKLTASGNGTGDAPTYTFYEVGNTTPLQTSGDLEYTTVALSTTTQFYVELNSNSACIDVTATNPVNSDTITINIDEMPTVVEAGDDNSICTEVYTLEGNIPSVGVGTWTSSDAGNGFDDVNLGTAEVSSLAIGSTTTLTWTIINGVCPSISDDVDITRTGALTASNAGVNDTVCVTDGVTLAANSVVTGETGTWFSDDSNISFTSPNDPLSAVTGLSLGDNILTWITSNGVCPNDSSDVIVHVEGEPSASITDPSGSQKIINADNTTLTAIAANTNQTGTWVVTEGTNGAVTSNANLEIATIENIDNYDEPITVCWIIGNNTGTCEADSACVEVVRMDVSIPDIKPQSDTVCISDLPLTILANPLPLAANGEVGAWAAVGGATFTASGDDITPTITTAGVYQYVYSISNPTLTGSPINHDTVTITIDDLPSTADAGTGQLICTSDFTLAAESPSIGTGEWSGTGVSFDDITSSTATVSNLSDGINTLTWTVSNGVCPASSNPVEINKFAELTTANAGSDETYCDDATVTLDANTVATAETGTWFSLDPSVIFTNENSESSTVTGLSVGNNELIWIIANGGVCPNDSSTVVITVDESPSIANAGNDSTICNTETSYNLWAETPTVGTGLWTSTGTISLSSGEENNPTGSFTNIDGQISMTWTVSNGVCTPSVDEVIITAVTPSTPTVDLDITNGTNPSCISDDVTFTATPSAGVTNASYSWTVNGNVQSSVSEMMTTNTILNGNVIEVTLTAGGCVTSPTATADVTMQIVNNAVPFVSSTPINACDEVTITGIPASTIPSTIQWYNALTGSPVTNATTESLSLSTSGSYYLVEENGVCPSGVSDTVDVFVNKTPVISLGEGQTVELGNSLTFDATISNGSISWSPEADLNDASLEDPTFTPTGEEGGYTTFTVTATEGICSSTASVTHFVKVPVRVPNCFTPNGDEENDTWVIKGLDAYPNCVIKIFNRWGGIVHTHIGTYEGWDGNSGNGNVKLPIATYYYVIDLGVIDEEPMTGTVTILK